MLIINFCLIIATVFLPLYLYHMFLWLFDSSKVKSTVEDRADTEVVLAQVAN